MNGGHFYGEYGNKMSYPSSMDVLGCLVCLILFAILVMLIFLAMRVVADTVRPVSMGRPIWPWSITTYNGWNQAIPRPPMVQASFPRPWVM